MKIKRLSDATPELLAKYHCQRCDRIIPVPETDGVYLWDGQSTRLVCPSCVRITDLYIWGNKGVLDETIAGDNK